jgi:2-polyprenyl-3-methyl-5-hydroxy-6-metoxy-1,4-benzoquinol methylase
MKLADKLLRFWRVTVALRYLPKRTANIFDIGCDDGYLLRKLLPITKKQDGIDPRLHIGSIGNNSELIKGFFPSSIREKQLNGLYDAVFALAVFEHFSESDLRESAYAISKMLSKDGRLIVTVPHPFVDKILDLLVWMKLVDGQALEEHHGFDPGALTSYFSDFLELVEHKRFQFGLNNIFVFKLY